jgi:hypothetical protein
MVERVPIEYLFWRECPSYEEGLRRLRQAAAEEGIDLDETVVEVRTDGDAERLRFVGSPTFRIDGRDLDPEAAAQAPHRLTCRLYRRADGRIGPLPDLIQLRQALRRAAEQRTERREEG